METEEFRVVSILYCRSILGGMLQWGSRILELRSCPGVYMRETTLVLSLWLSTYQLIRRSHPQPESFINRRPLTVLDKTVTLRKYNNRRLYDTVNSRYVTVEEIRRRLIDAGERVLTVDGDDVTADVLVLIIQADSRRGMRPALTAEALRRFIRSYLT
jgi:PHB/PHA accumulation regulator DNA-binding domain